MTIVRSHYRYKRPPGKRKAVPLEVPAVVTVDHKTRRRVSDRLASEAPAEAAPLPVASDDDRKPAIVRAKKPHVGSVAEPAGPQTAPAANDDRKSAIVTARRLRARGGNRHLLAELPDTEEEHRRRGDLADAMFQAMKRQIAEKARK